MMSSCYAKNFEQAFKVAESVYDSHQNLPTYWNQVATCYLLQGNERKALLFYNKALEVTPQYVPALNNIGVMYEKNGQDQKALVALQRALKNGKFTIYILDLEKNLTRITWCQNGKCILKVVTYHF